MQQGWLNIGTAYLCISIGIGFTDEPDMYSSGCSASLQALPAFFLQPLPSYNFRKENFMAKYQNKYAIPASAKNRPIWACAYDVDNDTGRSRLKQLPAKGIIQKDGRHETFYLLKKDGTPRANGVNASARCYADTYEECVKIYNDLVTTRIELLQNMIQETKEDYFVPKPL